MARLRLLGTIISEIKTEEGRSEFVKACVEHAERQKGLDASYIVSAKQYLAKSRLTIADAKDAAFCCRKYFQGAEAMPNAEARAEAKWQKNLAEKFEGEGR